MSEFKTFRQGDVYIRKIDGLPDGLKPKKDSAVAYGEVTGHAHTVIGDAEVMEDDKGNVFLKVNKDLCTMYHGTQEQIRRQQMDIATYDFVTEDNHKPHVLTEGCYQIVRQTEYDPYEGVVRQQRD